MFRKGLAVAVILLFIGICIIPSTAITEFKEISTVSFDGNTLYVGGSGPNNYTTIQSAIDDASDGDTVFVYDDSSPYYENVKIQKCLNLIGEDKNTTIIDGNMADCVIDVYRSYTNISRFTIQNSILGGDWNAGIFLQGVGNIYINNNIIKNNGYGIKCEYGDYAIISNNIIESNEETGIDFFEFRWNTISNNYICNNKGSGISTGPSTSNIVIYNSIDNNSNGISSLGGSNWNISHNIISNNAVGINLRAFLWVYPSDSYIILNEISNNDKGLVISRSHNNLISMNNFIDNAETADFNFFSFRNTWDANYWGGPQESPYVIKGKLIFFLIPWYNYDYNPAQEPYDIGG